MLQIYCYFFTSMWGLSIHRGKSSNPNALFPSNRRCIWGDLYSKLAGRERHLWAYVDALEYSHRNMKFCHDNKTSDDARNRVELWGVMIHVESWAKSSIYVIFSCMVYFDEDSTWIMTPHSSTLFLASSEVLWPLHKTMLRATTYPHVWSSSMMSAKAAPKKVSQVTRMALA